MLRGGRGGIHSHDLAFSSILAQTVGSFQSTGRVALLRDATRTELPARFRGVRQGLY